MYFVKTPRLLQILLQGAVFSIPNDKNEIYLTFDDGPHPDITPALLDLLAHHHIRATFFCIGKNVEMYPDLYKRIIEEGHSVGNHTYDHISGWTTNTNNYTSSVEKCSQFVKSNLFRPPYGRLSFRQFWKLKKTHRIIAWDVMPGDFEDGTSADKCVDRIVQKTKSGSIIVLHENDKTESKIFGIVEKSIDLLREKGFLFSQIT